MARIEPRPQVTCTENLVAFGRVVFEICVRKDKQTDRQTHMHAYHNTLHRYLGRSNKAIYNQAKIT